MEKHLLIFMSLSLPFSLFTMDKENAEKLLAKIRPVLSDEAFQAPFDDMNPSRLQLKLQIEKTEYSILLQQIRCNEKYNQFDPKINPEEDANIDDIDIELLSNRIYDLDKNILSIKQKQVLTFIFKKELDTKVYCKANKELEIILFQIKEEENKKSVSSNLLGDCVVS